MEMGRLMMRVDVERSVEIIAEVDAAATAEAWSMWFGREQSRGPWRFGSRRVTLSREIMTKRRDWKIIGACDIQPFATYL
jgi:hypothetical protein